MIFRVDTRGGYTQKKQALYPLPLIPPLQVEQNGTPVNMRAAEGHKWNISRTKRNNKWNRPANNLFLRLEPHSIVPKGTFWTKTVPFGPKQYHLGPNGTTPNPYNIGSHLKKAEKAGKWEKLEVAATLYRSR